MKLAERRLTFIESYVASCATSDKVYLRSLENGRCYTVHAYMKEYTVNNLIKPFSHYLLFDSL